ncbi:hypothetical protein [Marinimicrobium agarilyticum]|uniref:hypothetical protein n=1 Tax=Marinimicrobium agarilyticum TaxID=306546 RepID=UPI000411E8DC|nr:hypothetical protein [Marinimicrobium agarilyticum]
MGLHGWRLASLIGAALVGGYALATAVSFFLGQLLPVGRSEATLIGHLLGFTFYAVAILWVFAVRRPGKAWLYLSVASIVFSVAGMGLRG